jgi:hypothetical protein
MSMWEGHFCRGIFCEESGLPSYGRVQSFIFAWFGLAWISIQVWKTKTLPDPATLAGVLAFILGPYTVNKTAAVFTKPGSPTPTP